MKRKILDFENVEVVIEERTLGELILKAIFRKYQKGQTAEEQVVNDEHNRTGVSISNSAENKPL